VTGTTLTIINKDRKIEKKIARANGMRKEYINFSFSLHREKRSKIEKEKRERERAK